VQGDAPVLEGADPQLGSLQVDDDADRPPGLLLDPPDQVVALLVILMGSVAEIEPEHVGSRLEQGANDLRA